jgi:hypothetical protein
MKSFIKTLIIHPPSYMRWSLCEVDQTLCDRVSACVMIVFLSFSLKKKRVAKEKRMGEHPTTNQIKINSAEKGNTNQKMSS